MPMQRTPPRTSGTGHGLVRTTFAGRPEQPIIERHPKSRPSFVLLGLIIAGAVMAMLGSKVSLPELDLGSFGTEASDYAGQYEIRKVNLSYVPRGARTLWTIKGQVMNATSEQINGPRLLVQLVRGDDSVVAQGEVDYTRRPLPPQAGISLSYQIETAAGEALSARVTAIPPGQELQDR